MTPQAIVAALVIGVLLVLVLVLVVRLHDRGDTLVFVIGERDRAIEERDRASVAASRTNADLIALRGERAALSARIEHAGERIGELEDDLERYRTGPLLGQRVIVNTPRPDEQSIRGVVTIELDSGGLVLAAAELLETVHDRDGEHVEAQAIGDVVVPAYSWAQRVKPEA
jgi:hypothetical protein